MRRSISTLLTLLLIAAAVSSGALSQSAEERSAGASPPASRAQPGQDAGTAGLQLDFDTYRKQIEPIFLKPRAGGVRCYDCHSTLVTRLRLQPFSPGQSSWTEEQSRQNFRVVRKLVVPSAPLKSRLLLHPLAPSAGGDPAHTGGKFWKSQQDGEWQTLARWVNHLHAGQAERGGASSEGTGALDPRFFEEQVQPIFLRERPGHARCYGCHMEANRAFHLAPLAVGAAAWTAEQTRRNYESAVQQVVPEDPFSSRLLMHPLAPEAGGDAFHSGGRQFQSENDPDWLILAQWVRGQAAPRPPRAVRIYVTDSAADTVDAIDAATNRVVQVIRGIELPHGVAFSPDGTRIYISDESESVLDVVDGDSGRILRKVPLSGRPNNLAISKNGRKVLVGIRRPRGAIDVVEAASLRRTATIPVNASVHNVYVTPDGKYAVSGSIEGKLATVIDLEREQPAWEIKFDAGVRPMAFTTNPDGSTNRMFVQLSNFHGFAVVDFAQRTEIARIKLPEDPGGFGVAEGRTGTPSHGIGVAPDGKSLWVNSTLANAVFKYSLPELTLLGHAALPLVHPLGGHGTGAVPEWIAFTPDSKRVYVSNSGDRSVSVIDADTLQPVALVPVGEVPKRMNTLAVR